MSRRQQTVFLDDEARDRFAWRVLQDAWADANTAYWERRARQLEAARPRRGDWFPPHVTPQQISAQWDRLTEAAAACRARGQLTDVSRAQAEETLTDLASGAAA